VSALLRDAAEGLGRAIHWPQDFIRRAEHAMGESGKE
jgi:hypothetical protein